MDQSRVIAVNATTGKKRWSFQARGWIDGAAVATEKLVFFGSQDDFFYCLDKETGKKSGSTRRRAESNLAGSSTEASFTSRRATGVWYCFEPVRRQAALAVRCRSQAQRGKPLDSRARPLPGGRCFAAGEGQAYAVDRRKGTPERKLRPSPGSEIVCSPATDGSLIFLATRRTFQKRGQPSLVAVGVPPPAKQTGRPERVQPPRPLAHR